MEMILYRYGKPLAIVITIIDKLIYYQLDRRGKVLALHKDNMKRFGYSMTVINNDRELHGLYSLKQPIGIR